MKELDDLMERIEKLYILIRVKGKEYPANNPYLMNKINNLLHSGKLKIEDIEFDATKIELCDRESNDPYFLYRALEKISADICNEYNEIKRSEREGFDNAL
jgi:hypothetical protein